MKLLTLSLSLLCCSFQVVEDHATLPILTPALTSQKVAKIILNNGLEAYLISDPNASQSAAALSVEVGSWHDPQEHPGLAHFLEHMLFMGSTTYPVENEHSAFIRDHGGEENAYTYSDKTLYIFSIEHGAFLEGLDRFAHFFIDPLFSPSSIDRERNAVNEEFALHKENEAWKKWMIFKETGSQNHPNSHFCIGNTESLAQVTQEILQEWHAKYYSADKMHLALISPLPLEELIQEVEATFAPITLHNQPHTPLTHTLLDQRQKGHVLHLNSDSEGGHLELAWEIPSPFLKDHLTELSASAFKHPLKNSLLHYLKRKKWATDVDVSFDHVSKYHGLFSLELDLTLEGLTHINEAVYATFQALARQKEDGIPPFFHQELHHLDTLTYQYQSRENPFDLVHLHAFYLTEKPLATYPDSLLFPRDFSPKLFKEFIHTLTPENCLYILSASSEVTGIASNQVEKWTKTPYALYEVPALTMAHWSSAFPHPAIDYPHPNPYLPRPILKELIDTPPLTTLEQSHQALVYFQQDSRYLTPELAVRLSLYSPLLNQSAESEVLLSLLTHILNHRESPQFYFATEAGITFRFLNDEGKLTLTAEGFSDHLPPFLKTLFSELPSLTITEEQFEKSKESFLLSLIAAESSVDIAKIFFYETIYPSAPTLNDKLEALEGLTFSEFQTFANNLLQKTYLEGILYGNQTQEEASELWNTLKSSLHLLETYQKEPKLKVQIPEEETLIEIENDEGGHATLLALCQGEFTPENRSAQRVLSLALKEPFFDTLRTKQQTGYHVGSWNEQIDDQLFQFFSVISSQYSPEDLLERFESFLKEYLERLEEYVPKQRFEVLKTSTLASLRRPQENLVDQTTLLHFLLTEREGKFNFLSEGAAALEKLTYEQFLNFARNALDEVRPIIALLVTDTSE